MRERERKRHREGHNTRGTCWSSRAMSRRPGGSLSSCCHSSCHPSLSPVVFTILYPSAPSLALFYPAHPSRVQHACIHCVCAWPAPSVSFASRAQKFPRHTGRGSTRARAKISRSCSARYIIRGHVYPSVAHHAVREREPCARCRADKGVTGRRRICQRGGGSPFDTLRFAYLLGLEELV